MVDTNEANEAIDKTPINNIKQKRSFTYKAFFSKMGDEKPIKIIDYLPGFITEQHEITLVKNCRVKLKKNYIVEQDFVIIPTQSGAIHIPLTEIPDFCKKLSDVLITIGQYNER